MQATNLFVEDRRVISFFIGLMVFVSCAVLVPQRARGQVSATASIAGTVHDSTGAVIPGAQVLASQTATGFSLTDKSGAGGGFCLSGAPSRALSFDGD